MKRLLQFSLLITSIIAIIISCAKEEPEVKKFNLTVIASEGGSVSTQGGVYVEGEIARVTATPSDGYVFSGWSNGSSDNPIQITMNSNSSITANFTKVKYAIDITVYGQGSVTEEVVSSGKEYDSGSVVKLTAVPSEGWLFSHWSGASNVIENTVELTADSNKSITAHFIEIPFEAISVGDGTIATELVYNDSNEVTAFKLTATTPVGWRFDGWTGGVQSSEMIIEVATDLAENVTATFIQVYDLTLNIVGEGEVTDEIITDTSKTFDAGTNVKLTAVPASGWRFDKWTGSVESNEAVIVVNVDDAKEITATFIQVYDLTVTVEGEGAVTEEIITTTDKTTSYDTGVTVQLTAEPAEGWRFDRWTGAIESTETAVQIEMSEAKEVTAAFVKIYDLNITIVGEGEVIEEIVTETTKNYDSSTIVKLTAIPKDGWEFLKWEGAVTGVATQTQITIDKSKTVTATFSQAVSLDINIEGKGIVNQEKIENTINKNYARDSYVKLTAVPDPGWKFFQWTGSIQNQENFDRYSPTVSVKMNTNHEGTAYFQPLPLEVKFEVTGGGYIKITREDGTVIKSNDNFASTSEIKRLDRTVYSTYQVFQNEELLIEIIPDEYWELDNWNSSVDIDSFPKVIKIMQDTLDLEFNFKMTLPENYIVNEFDFPFDYPIDMANLGSTFSDPCGKFYLTNETGEYILYAGTTPYKTDPTPSILFKKVNNNWVIYKIYEEASMGQPRNFKILPNNEFVISDSGEHGDQPWLGNLFYGKLIGDNIEWKIVNKKNEQGFFHGVTIGDLNKDGLLDFGGVPNTSADGLILYSYGIFTQNQDGTFTKRNELWEPQNDMPFSINFENLFGDERDEIIVASYGGRGTGWNSDANRIEIYSYDSTSQRFILSFRSDQNPAYGENVAGATSIRVIDFNNDGLQDLSIAREGYPGGSFEVYTNNGDGTFNLSFTKLFNEDELRFREFLVMDANSDGNQDIILRTNGGSQFWPNSTTPTMYFINEKTVNLNHSIWLGNGDGTFSYYSKKDLTYSAFLTPYLLNPFMRNGKLCFFGTSSGNNADADGFVRHSIVEIEIDLN